MRLSWNDAFRYVVLVALVVGTGMFLDRPPARADGILRYVQKWQAWKPSAATSVTPVTVDLKYATDTSVVLPQKIVVFNDTASVNVLWVTLDGSTPSDPASASGATASVTIPITPSSNMEFPGPATTAKIRSEVGNINWRVVAHY